MGMEKELKIERMEALGHLRAVMYNTGALKGMVYIYIYIYIYINVYINIHSLLFSSSSFYLLFVMSHCCQ
jgi:hypothetical protein